MALLTVNGKVFDYPDAGSEPGWGEDATAWAESVTEALASLLGSGDILETTGLILNNQSTVTDVVGLAFSNSIVRAANIQYAVYRTTDTPTGIAESGTIYLTYNALNVGNEWTLTQNKNGDAEVSFSVTSLGQVQYISSNLAGGSYSGKIIFTAATLAQ